MAYTAGGYDSDAEGGGYGNSTGLGFTDKAVTFGTLHICHDSCTRQDDLVAVIYRKICSLAK